MRGLGIRGLVCLMIAFTLPFSLAPGINSVSAETIVPGGSVSGTWTVSGSPYLIQGNINVPADSTLTIEPGVQVSFQGGYGLTVNGLLEAVGTEADSIRFTAVSWWNGVTFNNAVDVSHVSYTSFSGESATLACDNSSPEISHCRISGGLYGILVTDLGRPNLAHCTISDNYRGIFWQGSASGIISDCVIAGNATHGGGWAQHADTLTFVDCMFDGNTASPTTGGGAFCSLGSFLIFSRCTFTNNETTSMSGLGGAVSCINAGATFTDCTFRGNISNCGTNCGGGAVGLSSSDATFTRCTLSENGAARGGAIEVADGSSYALDHCTVDGIFWGYGTLASDGSSSARIENSIVANSPYGAAIYAEGALEVDHTAFFNNYWDVYGSIPPGFGDLIQTNANGDSCDVYYNIFMDPLYVNQPGGDFHLQAESPCIDAGDPADPPDPDGTVPDMGAFAFYQGTAVPRIVWPITLEKRLSAARPNPFRECTEIRYTLDAATPVHMAIFDIQGRLVTTLLDGIGEAGTHPAVWDGTDEAGIAVMPGIYFVRLEAEGFADTRTVLLLR